MPVISTQRPGIYSNYEASGIIYTKNQSGCVGIVAKTNLIANSTNEITTISDAETIFGANSTMVQLCTLALKNGAFKAVCVSVDVSSPDYEEAFEILKARSDIYVIICDSEDSAVHQQLKASVLSASESKKERLGIVACAADANVEQWAQTFNSERIILIAQNPSDANNNTESGCKIAAALAGLIVSQKNPTQSFNSAELIGISKLAQAISEEDIDDYISAGVTPVEIILQNAQVIRLVTSKTTTNNVADNTFKDINTILIVDEVIPSIRKALKDNLLGSKNNALTRSSIATQTVVELEKFLSEEIISGYEQPVVGVSESDPTICIVNISFEIPYGLNQIQISANISV